MRNYERATHDPGKVIRTSMAPGVLTPVYFDTGLPGDTYEMDLSALIMTLPTTSMLFGSFKFQIDVFSTPYRLFNREVMYNAQGIGLRMENVKMPQMVLKARPLKKGINPDTAQVNPSSIFAYTGIRGLGNSLPNPTSFPVMRTFNACRLMAYYDTVYNYYVNKQEGIGYLIHNNMSPIDANIQEIRWIGSDGGEQVIDPSPLVPNVIIHVNNDNNRIEVDFSVITEEFDVDEISFVITRMSGNFTMKASEIYETWEFDLPNNKLIGTNLKREFPLELGIISCDGYLFNNAPGGVARPKLQEFDLKDIEKMRVKVMEQPSGSPLIIDENFDIDLYRYPFEGYGSVETGQRYYSATAALEGLCVKTYQSDMFQNWMDKEWIDLSVAGSINDITKIDTSEGFFTIDTLILKRKIYNSLNRTALGDGGFDAWQMTSYGVARTAETTRSSFHGGLSQEIVFDSVVSTASTDGLPLGTIAGRGTLNNDKNGGHVKIRLDEHSIIMAIASITPRIDYSQGNSIFNDLRDWNDFHKPEFNGIGWQNLMTDQMCFYETRTGGITVESRVVGKQPAWLDYTTAVNEVYGNFADRLQQMYQVNARRYDIDFSEGEYNPKIGDITTYIDPSKFNYIFADARIDAQNFLVQIGMNINKRSKVAAKQMPNL